MKYALAPEIKTDCGLVKELKFDHVKTSQIHCIRSLRRKDPRICPHLGMSRLFKEVAGLEPNYIIEVIAKRFDKLSEREKMKTLIHELMHIPKTFSGALLSHRGPHHAINDREVERILMSLRGV